MNKSTFWGQILVCFFIPSLVFANSYLKPPKPTLEGVILECYLEVAELQSNYENASRIIFLQISEVNQQLYGANDPITQLHGLLQKDRLRDELRELRLTTSVDIHKIKYIKGLQIIKLLYEKTLSLDHHFASVATFNDINSISNPNSYPEFKAVKDLIGVKKNAKSGFDISGILGENIYTSLVHSFVSLFNSKSTNRSQKDAAISEVECILDFTLQMHNQLNTIYFETEFLKRSNQNITGLLEQLFVDFTKPIGYTKSLYECREGDNWDEVRNYLGVYLKHMNTVVIDDTRRTDARKMQIELQFPIERLLQFIIQYNAFIDQATQFYEKFAVMLNGYRNDDLCSDRIPTEFSEIKTNIEISIDKFKTAYRPVEINGSKMKEILYGLTEYD